MTAYRQYDRVAEDGPRGFARHPLWWPLILDVRPQVWEVAAQMLGLGGSILALRAIEDSGSPTNVLWAWATFQVCVQLKALQLD